MKPVDLPICPNCGQTIHGIAATTSRTLSFALDEAERIYRMSEIAKHSEWTYHCTRCTGEISGTHLPTWFRIQIEHHPAASCTGVWVNGISDCPMCHGRGRAIISMMGEQVCIRCGGVGQVVYPPPMTVREEAKV